MTVGNAIAERTGLRVFHNHLTIEPVLRFFEFGTPPFHRLVESFRTAVLEEVAASDLPGLRRLLLETDTAYQLNSTTEFEGRDDYLRVDNTLLSPYEVADRAIRRFRLAERS